jgi:hypothetical protein
MGDKYLQPTCMIGNYYTLYKEDGTQVRARFSRNDAEPFFTDDGIILLYNDIDLTKTAEEYGQQDTETKSIED